MRVPYKDSKTYEVSWLDVFATIRGMSIIEEEIKLEKRPDLGPDSFIIFLPIELEKDALFLQVLRKVWDDETISKLTSDFLAEVKIPLVELERDGETVLELIESDLQNLEVTYLDDGKVAHEKIHAKQALSVVKEYIIRNLSVKVFRT